MKILFVVTDLDLGGAELMLLRILSRLDRNRFQVQVINLKRPGPVQKMLESIKIPVHHLNMSSLYSLPRVFFYLQRFMKTWNPDLIQGWMYQGNLAAQLAKKIAKHNGSLLWWGRYSLVDLSTNKMATRFLIRFSAWTSKYVQKIIFNSYQSARQHQKIGYPADSSLIIPNGLNLKEWKRDESAYLRLRAELHISSEAKIIGLVGRYDVAKDHSTFIQAARDFAKNRTDVHFVFVGPGMEDGNPVLKQWLQETNLVNHFHLLGERKDIPYLMSGFDVNTVSSRTESFPNVLIEAMATETLSVASDVGDTAEILGETGFLFQPRDPVGLRKAWESLLHLSFEETRLKGQQARERVAQHYSLEKVVQAYQDVYALEVQR